MPLRQIFFDCTSISPPIFHYRLLYDYADYWWHYADIFDDSWCRHFSRHFDYYYFLHYFIDAEADADKHLPTLLRWWRWNADFHAVARWWWWLRLFRWCWWGPMMPPWWRWLCADDERLRRRWAIISYDYAFRCRADDACAEEGDELMMMMITLIR